jgi:hypothetical protein
VPVLILIAVVAVLAGVFLAATGRGGELAYERVDHAPLDLGPVSAPDIAMLRPPTAMWGYNVQVTDEALDLIAHAMRDRDVTIAYLQQQLANRVSAGPDPAQVRQTAGSPATSEAPWAAGSPATSEAPWAAGSPATSEAPWAAENPDAPQAPRAAKAPGVLVAPLPQRSAQPSATAPSPEAAQPGQATQPSQTLPSSYDVQGPQGAYDTHDWWAEQEEAAREEEARRQAGAQEAGHLPPDEADPPDASGADVNAPEADPLEVSSPYDRIRTLPNPVITSPGETATSSGHGDWPANSSAPPVPPDEETHADAEEQGW